MPDSKYVLYHGNCYDGFGAAFVAWKNFKDEAYYISCDYPEKDAPLEKIPDNSEVYVIDFSFSRDALIKANERFSKLVVLDHHATAEENLKGLDFCKFDMGKSGAGLALEYFPKKLPLDQESLILYIQDRDLWKFSQLYTKEIHAALTSYPMSFHVWDGFKIKNLISDGRALLRQMKNSVRKICDNAVLVQIDGHSVPACSTSEYFSEIPAELLERFPNAPFAAYWTDYLSSGKLIRRWGLRSRGDFNVSEVAKKFGGGGHKAASAFTMSVTLLFQSHLLGNP
jgi:oligoribonuclease NrnB/cAMP/cGMP phosphodiesterase (DHH superfamily)